MKVGVFGVGVVGTALAKQLETAFPVARYDKFRPEYQKLAPVLETDVLFMAVPTPMNEDGTQDLSAVLDAIETLKKHQYGGIVIMKSTTLPGTVQTLSRRSGLTLVHSPEFLTERAAEQDAKNQRTHLFAGPKRARMTVSSLMRALHPDNQIEWFDDPTTTELAKYLHNCMLAVKVGFCNEIYELCRTLDADYEQVRRGAVAIGVIGANHTAVPGPDGAIGFGGMCFPKDTSALLQFATSLGLNLDVLKATVAANRRRRPDAYAKVSSARPRRSAASASPERALRARAR